MREMQADFAQKIGELIKQKEDLEKELAKVESRIHYLLTFDITNSIINLFDHVVSIICYLLIVYGL